MSPLDGTKLTGSWSFFVNGVPGPQLDSDYVVKSGDTIVWAYAPGDTVPNPDEVVVDPSAPRPTDWKSDWDGKSNAAVENVSTPTGALASSWTFDWKAYSGSAYPNASEPIVVNGNVYLAVNKRLLKIDAGSGKVLAESNLKTAVGYTSRPIYANGLVIVPLDGGAVQALTADALTTVWVTDSVSRTAQSNSQLTVDGNYLYVGTVDVDYGTSTYNNGHLTRINILTGAVSWQHVNADEGYYWTGATVGDDYVLVPTSAGTVEMLSKSSGDVLGSVSVGAVVNSSCVLSADGGHAYLISRDGKLHVLAISDGDSRDADAASRITEERS
ncbi:MAG: PQQ-binding-like beta-propeller repeat protein [Collinsella sp.]